MNQDFSPEIPNQSVAFIKASWHKDIVDNGYQGFVEEMNQLIGGSCKIEVFDVPGAFEIPLLAKDLAKTGQYSAVVCCGFVVDGGVYRHEYVADAVVSALMQIQLETGVPLLSVVLTPKSFSDSDEDHAFFLDHFNIKGQEAANACLSILNTRKTLFSN
jgi:6,7-dimethyl-8-ribityllumazine synthase